MRATQRLYLTWDRKRVVYESNPDGRYLFCKPGDEIPDEEARKYGLLPVMASASAPQALEPTQKPEPKKAAAAGKRGKPQTPGEDLDTRSDDELLGITEKLQVEIPDGGREALIVAILKKTGYVEEAAEREKKAAAAAENKMAGKPQDKGAHFPPESKRQ